MNETGIKEDERRKCGEEEGGVRRWGERRMWMEVSFAGGSIMMLERLKGETGCT